LLHEELGHLWTRLEPTISEGIGFPTTIACCATRSGEGTTTVTTNLAILLGEQGIATCIVEANLRRPALIKHFKLLNKGGLNKALSGTAKLDRVIVRNVAPGVDLVPAVVCKDDTYSLFRPEELRSFLEELRQRYEVVLIDAPPLSTSAEAGIILGAARGVILVVEANRTRRHPADRSVATINELGVPLLGAVLNRMTYEIPATIEAML